MTHSSARGSDSSVDPATAARTPPDQRRKPATIALVGNPNTGKTALFNALTGYRRHVANYPGVTVDVGRGRIRNSDVPLELLDLPGTYSLAAASPDEVVVCRALRGDIAGQRVPDVILAIADASNLTRNLYLVSQLLETGRSVVVALNMNDVAEQRGIFISADTLSERLGVPVVKVVATRPETVRPLVAELQRAVNAAPAQRRVPLPEPLLEQARGLSGEAGIRLSTCEALRVLAHAEGQMAALYAKLGGSGPALAHARQRLAELGIEPGPAEVRARYAWISEVLDEAVQRGLPTGRVWSDGVDRFLTHRLGGGAVLLVVLYALFYSVYSGAGPLMKGIEWIFGHAATLAAHVLPAGVVQSAVSDGLLGGGRRCAGVPPADPHTLLVHRYP